ncbi:MAG: putative DNA binding domain-containing protein [Dysgonamonadaceae bacterium]|jgi:ATP-dependent DNA helicase RecG|nr:putative DNA binding domain-containing protein [Dysgonamonadaceae bacterium]
MLTKEEVKAKIAQGEGLHVEFKTAAETLPRNVYEIICAFLNRKGGYIFLGVKDNGKIEGISEKFIPEMLKTLANDINNMQIMMPPARIETEVFDVDDKKIVCIYVPESFQAHSHKGFYYDRRAEGDYKLTTHHLIAGLYLRKQDVYSENRVFPLLKMEDFVSEDFDYVRNIVGVFDKKHSWVNMTNEEILRSAKMYLQDTETGKSGYTLAAALVFGKPETIARVCPQYKTDALCRKEDVLRYDDRDTVNCNLLQAYERLMNFVRKHTPDRFYLEGDVRLSIRDIIFREMITNMLIHREFYSYFRATLTVYKDTVVAENGNIPYIMGRITPENLNPHTKNPTLFAFFKQINWVEDLGSGVRNMYKYCPIYVKGSVPIMEEDDIFRQTVRYETEKPSVKQDISNTEKELVLLRENPKITAKEIVEITQLSLRAIRKIQTKLKNSGIIERQGSKKDGIWVVKDKDDLNI